MQAEENENRCPNQPNQLITPKPQPTGESPQLADLIRDNIHYQLDQSIKRTLFKESLLKASLDKEFQDLFHHVSPQPAAQQSQGTPNKTPTVKPTLLQVSPEVREVCSWLEDSSDFAGFAYMPYEALAKLVSVLHQKVEGTAIILTPYPQQWIRIMEDLCRLSKLKWGVLMTQQEPEAKVRVLELFELRKLKLLFVTPSLLFCEDYHRFQCDLLMIPDLQLYNGHQSILHKAIAASNPGRVLGLYHSLLPNHYDSTITEAVPIKVRQQSASGHNLIVLRTTQEEKFKIMQTYLSRGEYRRILVLVNRKSQGTLLSRKLLLESKTCVNLFDYLGVNQASEMSCGQMLNQLDHEQNEQRIGQLMRRIGHSDITISSEMDWLKLCHFDIVIYYCFTDVPMFVQSCFTTKEKLLLFAENDYHNFRNSLTAELTPINFLQKAVMAAVEKPTRPQEVTRKRCYSDYVDDRLLQPYTVSKQLAEKNEEKVLRLFWLSRKHQLPVKFFNRILNALQEEQVISINYRTCCEAQVDIDSISRLQKHFPDVQEVRRKIDLLATSTQLETTVRGVLERLQSAGIRYKVSEEAVQFKVLTDYQSIEWESLLARINQPIQAQAARVDQSFNRFRDCAYGSVQLTRRERTLQKKNLLLNFKTEEINEEPQEGMRGWHRSNLLTSQIEEWLRLNPEMGLTQHELILLLQGLEKGRVAQFKEDAVFGRYRRLKYEQLNEALSRIFQGKKMKLQ